MERKTIIQFCKRNIWPLLSAFFCLAALIFFLDQKCTFSKKASSKDFITAKALFDRIYANECLSKESLESACDLLNKYPELDSQYQGILSLALAQSGFTGVSTAYIQSQLSRTEPIFSAKWHKEFATTGFLISESQYELALEKAISLDHALQNESSYPRLRAFNQLRIAFLAHQVHHDEVSKKAFLEVQASPFFSEIQTLFSEKTYSLNDFFHESSHL